MGRDKHEGHEFEASQDTEEREGVRWAVKREETKREVKQNPSACLLRATGAKIVSVTPSPTSGTAVPSEQDTAGF